MQRTLAIVWLVVVGAGLSIGAQDWSGWRGAGREGTATAFVPPFTWPERPTLAWTVKDAGEGHASPVVSGDRVFLHSRIGDREAATAFDAASGRQVWRQAYDAPYRINPAARGHGMGPKSTPIAHGGRLFTLGISGILTAFEAGSGRVEWRKEFTEFAATSPLFGTAMSPAVDGRELIVHVGGPGNGAVVVLDVETGAERWRWAGDGPGYASPIVVTLAGMRQVVTQTERKIVGLSRGDGRLLWEIPFTTDYDQNIVTPVVHEGLLIYSGLGKPTTAVRVAQAGGRWTVEQVWQNADVPMYMSSPVLAEGLLFGLTHRNRGQFFCLDATTGKTLWTTRGREGENAALLVARDLLLAVTTEGELLVARQSPKSFDLVRRYTLAESPVWAHPAPYRNGLIVKDVDSLSYWIFHPAS